MKMIQISAGSTHSAAVTENLKAYTWGNGVYGRLGHGSIESLKKPTILQDLAE